MKQSGNGLFTCAVAVGMAYLISNSSIGQAENSHLHGPATLGPGHTALWYDPARSGEGWSLEVLTMNRALVYWFTYDEVGQPRWLLGDGEIVDGRMIEFPELLAVSGPRFGPDFDPDDVILEVVGSALFVFEDCDSGWAEFNAYEQSFTVDLKRLNRSMLIDCDPPEDAVDEVWGHQSGSWYDPATAGQGFSLQWMVNGLALMTWFSFDLEGNPYWMQAVGERVDELLHFDFVYSTSGPVFGQAFNPDAVELAFWGTLTMTLDCLDGTAIFDSELPGFGSGSMQLERLTIPAALECEEEPDPPPGLSQFVWHSTSSGPALSEMPAAALGDYIYLAGGMTSLQNAVREVWRYHPASGQWARMADLPDRRDHGMMAAHGDRLYFFGGYRNVLSGASNTAWSYNPASNTWSNLPAMPTTRAAGGAATFGDYIYVTGGVGNAARATISRFHPPSNNWQTFDTDGFWDRDHAAVVAYQGEIWIVGGRGGTLGDHNIVTIFDPQTGNSRQGPSMRSSRSGFAIGVYNDYIVAAGGEVSFPPMVVSTAEAYSPETGWQVVATPPLAVHGAGSAGFADGFYMLSGSVVVNNIVGVARVQRFGLPDGE